MLAFFLSTVSEQTFCKRPEPQYSWSVRYLMTIKDNTLQVFQVLLLAILKTMLQGQVHLLVLLVLLLLSIVHTYL